MRHRFGVAAVALVPAVLMGCALLREPEDDWYRDLRPAHWIWWGAEEQVLAGALERIRTAPGERRDRRYDTILAYGPGHWVYEFYELGRAREAAGQRALAAGDPGAGGLLHQASVYYGLAKYPGLGVDAHEREAHARQLATYEQSQSLNGGIRFEIVRVDSSQGSLRGYLHLPRSATSPVPLVVATNGIDVFKAEFGPIVDELSALGIGLFAFDMPSTGEAAAMRLTPEIDQVYVDVLEALGRRRDVDAGRLALWGVSFGGNPVVRVALRAPRGLRAAVNWCGPIHEVFQIRPWQLSLVDDMYLDVLRHRIQWPTATNRELAAAMRGFSLVDAGLLLPGEVVTPVPILSVNARGDYVAPEADLDRVTAASREGMLFYSGADDHCPQQRADATARTIAWLAERLAE